jgi:phage protein D
MDQQPDFIITINGQDVSQYARRFSFTDDEEGQSEIEVELGNPDMKLSGQFDYEEDLQIRFGYQGNMSGMAYLPIAEVKESYKTKGEDTITVIGRDESSKMSGGKEKGVKGKDKTDMEMVKRAAKEAGMKAAGENAGDGGKHTKALVCNENLWEQAKKFARCVPKKGGSSSGGNQPKSPFKSGGKGQTFSSAERLPKGGKDRDKNRGGNHENSHASEPVTGTLRLKGYPTLKAKSNVTVVDFGGKASGTYYVKKAQHEWQIGGNFVTVASLVRGGSGKGGAGGDPPTVMYADVWKKGELYFGPRKMDGGSQGTFRRGDGYVIDFEYHLKPQKDRHGGEGSEGEGLDDRDKGEAFKAAKEAGKAAAGGGS